MQITFDLPHVFAPGSDRAENAATLAVLLDCLVSLNLVFRRFHPHVEPLAQAGVVYDRTTVWDTVPALYSRGYGDCKSLAAARVAELLVAGIPARPVFRWAPNGNGSTDYHILVQTPQGWEDPSKTYGMLDNEFGNAYGMEDPVPFVRF